eukprot:CAMPEP_0116031738 /NCGR_PEP_ID=MMETSP0321-20121206/17735_1 /TAXON_ID=163516 /ORGANISM="Leptocylindrus danicus var. danicus, Strain B650" /LENGTH=356 /DNA_ID=CAMNT_0003507005 /DNA_START=147 /DNA_END=1217 /DNA_ORIENTATION=-
MVYHYLSSNDSYDAEECLKLCQEHEIADASAYLLERMGNVTSALQLILQTLEGRMMTLKKVVRASLSSVEKPIRGTAGRKERDAGEERKEVEIQGMKQMLMAALELCERNYGSEQNEHGPRLWFNVLDRLMGARGFLRLSKELPHHAAVVSSVLNDLLQITMQRMVSNVSLPDLVQKITTDHRSHRLGEFREMITSMLRTYNCEVEVCTSATEAMHYDVRTMSLEKMELKIRGAHVRSIMGKSLRGKTPYDSSKLSRIIRIGVDRDAIAEESKFVESVDGGNDSAVNAAINRLRNKQIQRQASKQKIQGRARSSLNMMSRVDMNYEDGELSEAAMHLGQRHIGLLSEPMNVGSFRV